MALVARRYLKAIFGVLYIETNLGVCVTIGTAWFELLKVHIAGPASSRATWEILTLLYPAEEAQ